MRRGAAVRKHRAFLLASLLSCPVHTCWWHCQRQDTGLDGPSDPGQLLCCKASTDRDAEPPHSKELCLTTSFASVFTCANSSWGVLGAWGSYLIDVCLC